MGNDKSGMHGVWGSRLTFILAATGSAVGLGNIWKFPYIIGENGGGAFVLMYLLCILATGIPVMMAEILLGRRARMSPIHTMKKMVQEEHAPKIFKSVGWMGAASGFLILSFYTVIAGWMIAYIGKMISGDFTGADRAISNAQFSSFLADPLMMSVYHTIFVVMAMGVVARGIHKGLEDGVRMMMPMLFFMLVLLFGYALTTPGFSAGWDFMFKVDFSKITTDSVVVALGHSFFTLSLGMGAIMAYGSYMPKQASLGKTVMIVATLDTMVAVVAGLIIFPIVFSYGLAPDSGPGLLFQTLPIAFGALPGGAIIGALFFTLVLIAAWSSAISIAEPAVAWAVEKGFSRAKASLCVGVLAWLLGFGSILSFSDWGQYQTWVTETHWQEEQMVHSEFHLFANVETLKANAPEGVAVQVKGKTFFDTVDALTANIMMPLGGIMIAFFVGWFMRREVIAYEARIKSTAFLKLWLFVLRYISPLAVASIFVSALM